MAGKKIAILGGGISGLVCAHRLLELKKENACDFEIMLFEASSRLGGTIETEKNDGFILEKGPDAFISEKPAVLNLCKRLGLESEIISTKNENRKSFILRNRKLIPLPQGFYMIAPTAIGPFFKTSLFSLPGKVRMMLEPFVPADKKKSDESVAHFIRRRFGKEALDRVGQAMVAGIHTGDPERLSVMATLPRFKHLEQKYGSVVRGLLSNLKEESGNLKSVSGPRYSLFLSFRNGMQTLTEKIIEKLPPTLVQLNTPIREVSYDTRNKQWRLVSANGQVRMADVVCSTLPAHFAREIFEDSCHEISKKLGDVDYESVLTINLAYRRQSIPHLLDGFGFVVPKLENSALVAVSFSSQKFDHRAPAGFVLLRAFVGGAFGRNWFERKDQELESIVEKELAQILGTTGKPVFSVLQRYPRSMVQYSVGHLDWVESIESECRKYNGLFLAGSAYRGVGIPDCIRDAEAKAEEIFKCVTNQ